MNWILVSLPLIASLSASAGLATLFYLSKLGTGEIRVPAVRVNKEPDLNAVREGFSKVFEVSKTTAEGGGGFSAPSNIKLIGISGGGIRAAMLSLNGKKLILMEGEEKGGVFLKKVERSSVRVVSAGREFVLKMERKKSKGSGSFKEKSSSPVRQTPSGEVKVSRREIERITKDPGVMFREIRLVPYVKNGRTEGFIFEWIKPGSLLYQAGLRAGDILVSINNNTIRSGEDAFRLLQILRNEPTLRVQIIRNGQPQELYVRVE